MASATLIAGVNRLSNESRKLAWQRVLKNGNVTVSACIDKRVLYAWVVQIDQHTGCSCSKMLSIVKTLTKKQQGELILAEAKMEMAKPVATLSAREQDPSSNDGLVVKHDADERTVDVHSTAVVLDKA